MKLKALIAAVALVAAGAAHAAKGPMTTGIGNSIDEKDLVLWNIDVHAYSGKGLPEGTGNIADGEELYQAQCAMCHGEFGEGVRGYPKLAGGETSELNATAERSFGSYWGTAPGLFDYIRRAMPFFAPQSLSADQVYSIVGYIMYDLNGLEGVEDDTVINAEFLTNYVMPNRDGFFTDDRPDLKAAHGSKNKWLINAFDNGDVEIKGKAVKGDVSVGAVE